MNRILFKAEEIGEKGTVRLSGARAKHVLEVLHGKPGQKIRIGVVDGNQGGGMIEEAGKGFVMLRCALDGEVPPVPMVDLLLAMPRPKVMKRLWAQITAMGVGRVVVVNAEKVERNYFDTKWLEQEHYEPLLIEGLTQCGDTRLPQVLVRRRLKVFVEDEMDKMFPESSRFLCHPGGVPAVEALRSRREGRVLIAIGPEGGWTEFELNMLESHGFVRIGMGKRLLRSDTACVSMLALVHGVMAD